MRFKELHEAEVTSLGQAVRDKGFCVIPSLVSDSDCTQITQSFDDNSLFRSTVVMERYGYGMGEYKYFAYPLPDYIDRARRRLYGCLLDVARDWASRSGGDQYYPENYDEFLEICRNNSQSRATPLLLHYLPGGHNRLHQDNYGKVAFPFQVVILLSSPNIEFTGGEFMLVEQHPRQQSVGRVVNMKKGDALIFPNASRYVETKGRCKRVNVRHGVSEILSGERFSLGIVFHDAE